MANYYESARSNYFKVKDAEAFKKAMEPYSLETAHEKDDLFCLLGDEGGFSWWNSDDDTDADPVELIAPHLADNEVCILMAAGAEKLRYISGYATAFNNQKRIVQICLDDIYNLARKEFGAEANITQAEY